MTHEEFSKLSGMNLLIITPMYPNKNNTFIGSIFVKNQVEYLKTYFKQIIIIVPTFFSFKKLEADKLCYDYTYDNVKVYYPRCYYVPITYFNKILIDNRLKTVCNLIEKENIKFDLIHSHFTWPSGYIGAYLKRKYNSPFVITIHENEEWFNREVSMNYSRLNNSWKEADALIRVNKKDAPILRIYNENTLSIPNSFSPKFKMLDKNKCREVLNLPHNKKILFSVGNLIMRKGFSYLIDAMKIIHEKRDDVICLIGGSGPLKDKLQKKINDYNLTNFIKLVGFIPDESLPLFMNSCDLFVLPSLSESFGIVQIEAMACGKPVIATYNGGSEEIITSNSYGCLVEPKNSIELAQKILRSLDSPWDNAEIGRYSRSFSPDIIIDKILTTYTNVLN